MCDREALKAELKEELQKEFVPREEFEQLQKENAELRETVQEQEDRIDELEEEAETLKGRIDRKTTAALEHIFSNEEALQELQERELEKGAYLYKENVKPGELSEGMELAEVLQDDAKRYYHVPGADSGLDRDGSMLGWEDLLPIQQLARTPDEQRDEVIGSTQTERAVWLWENRDDLLKKGSGKVDRFIDSGDLQRALSVEYGIARSSEAAKRVMEAFRDATLHRTYIEKIRSETGEARRLVIPADAEIPGEGTTDAGESHNVVSA